MNINENLTIIGSGPAGWTAAIYAARAHLNPILFEGEISGGQLMNTSIVENFPGFPDGINGPDLMMKFRNQALSLNTRVISTSIKKINLNNNIYKLIDSNDKIYFSKSIIIATGATSKLLGLPKEKELMSTGGGVSVCATCDGPLYKDCDIAVIGGGDSALEEALHLSKFTKSVTLIHRRKEFRASKIMIEKIKNNNKINIILDSIVINLITKKNTQLDLEILSHIEIKNIIKNKNTKLSIDGIFIAIGHTPNSHIFNNLLKLDDTGFIITNNNMHTSKKGIFACGDVQDKIYKQAITAAGSGCIAALEAEKFLI